MSIWLLFLMCGTNYTLGVAVGWMLATRRRKFPCYGQCGVSAHMKEDGCCHTEH